MSDNPVVFQNVTYRVSGRVILDRLSLEVPAGETLVLLGRSGSGKTTALKMVNGLLFPSSGEVIVKGKATTEWNPIQLRRSIGYVIQEIGLFPHFTIERNVGLVPRLEHWPEERIHERARELLAQVGLEPDRFLARYPRQLSGGQRQRVGVARALAADPAILLFDEPFGAVDPVTRLELQNQFLALRQAMGKTSIFVTHDIREALRIGSRIGLLHDGQLEELSPPREFLASRSSEARAFLAGIEEPAV